ncbi:hypothetical protein F6U93_04910 [Tamlana haliotis]|uniref:Redox-active disulfide protein 2 n=1 Tax=Pseudotamlana haliotis TaxID=2614804 RepID=A0A6N6MLE8_9FLAO|nr:hypothetical protein [Tamlana haliotis]KAB1069097.1 hypothetical protein F6U93_04910 [Tamlana haliotis]
MKLNEKTTERLAEELRALKVVNSVLIGLLSILFMVTVYGLLKKNDTGVFSALIVVPIASSLIVLSSFGKMKKIKAELESRK